VRRQSGQGGRLSLVQVIEDAGLPRAHQLASLRIGNVPGVAGEEDSRVVIKQAADVFSHHGRKLKDYFVLSNQIVFGHLREPVSVFLS
jgi:hypothetical protein